MKYEIITNDSEKRVNLYTSEKEFEYEKFTKWGLKYPKKLTLNINRDENDHEYFLIPNFRSEINPLFNLFNYLIQEAIDEVKYGLGDVIIFDNYKNENYYIPFKVKVIRYLDRYYGNEIRKKTLERWNNENFCYSILVYQKNSLFTHFLDSNYKLIFQDEDICNRIEFENEDDGYKLIDHFINLQTEVYNIFKSIEIKNINKILSVYPGIVILGANRLVSYRDIKLNSFYTNKKSWILKVVKDVKH